MGESDYTFNPPELLRSLSDAVKSLNSSASVEEVLQQIARSSRKLLKAKYSAVTILKPDTSIAEFVTDGLRPDAIKKIGDPPRGRGLLGAVIESGEPIRTADIAADRRAHGFPPNHPPMSTFLGVPIRVADENVGTLYVTEKLSQEEFSAEDEWIATVLAEHAGIAVHKARLLSARETFISIAAHELRTPVGGAQLAVETAIERAESKGQSAFDMDLLLDVKGYVEDLAHLIEDLLDVSRLEHGTFRLRRGPADLREVCRTACSRMELSYGEHRIKHDLGDVAISGLWDRARLERTMANLLENALRFSDSDSTVEITARNDGRRGTVTIKDTGPGIRDDDLRNIWKPFAQGSSRGADHHGAGIGLYIVREIVEAHSGSVELKTELGKGTTVTVHLPRVPTS